MVQPAVVKMNYTLRTFDSAKDLAREAALRWLDAMADCDLFTVALSGGRIPKLLYAEVVAQASEDAFANAHFFGAMNAAFRQRMKRVILNSPLYGCCWR